MNSGRNDLFEVKILNILQISSSSIVIQLPKYSAFKAGQVINLSADLKIPPRMYSIASGEQDLQIDILLKIVPEGELTPVLNAMKKGDSVWVSNPFGGFLATPDPAFLIATGTGIAPFVSMIRSGYAANKILLHGSRQLEDFYYADFLEKKLGENYIRCISGSDPSILYRGRITSFLASRPNIDTNLMYYLCGSAEMVVETRQLLISKEVSFKNILSEIYF